MRPVFSSQNSFDQNAFGDDQIAHKDSPHGAVPSLRLTYNKPRPYFFSALSSSVVVISNSEEFSAVRSSARSRSMT